MNLLKTIEKIKEFEGFRSSVYYDLGGNKGTPTIGYGFTDKALINKKYITRKEADEILAKKVIDTYESVCKYLDSKHYHPNLNQLCALTDFTYNLGMGNLKKLCAYGFRDLYTIGAKIKLYNKAGGKVLKGLQKRRQWETDCFYGRM